ncbi:hypothetical protein HMPREF1860_01085 [Prevotella amnii]|uniref:Uncharacterized protein n=1 Tax=Prevotella amnii TaxID=419005 RepID=A0A134BDL4_9BACT|nr:hypothetical protein HMPREF1860_01085 [Prevotella amnii]
MRFLRENILLKAPFSYPFLITPYCSLRITYLFLFSITTTIKS